MTFKLRQYQEDAVSATLIQLAAGVKRCAVIMPTGAGKTSALARTIEEYIASRPDSAALVLSHLSLLTKQSSDRFKTQAPRLNVGIIEGKKRPSLMNNTIITTVQSARNPKHIETIRNSVARKVDLIVVDETHYLPTASYELVQSYYPNAQVIGYTATPFREKKLMTNFFDSVAYTISLQELIDQGYLVPPVVKEVVIDGNDPHAGLLNVSALYQLHELDKKAIVYTRTIHDAKLMTLLLEQYGIKSAAVTSEVTGVSRDEIFDRFTNGDLHVLTTVDVLTAGFDAPSVEAIFMPFGTKSPTQYLQRIGRGLRPSPGKTSCRVYMLGDAPHVQNKIFERINRIALNAGKSKPGFDTYRDDLELTFWDKSAEIYHWTSEVVDLIKHMDKIGMKRFASLLNEKHFPPQFMANITELMARLPKTKSTMPKGGDPATESQKSILFDNGFTGDTLRQMAITKAEASMMISAIFNKSNDPHGRSKEFIIQSGHYKGKHVCELPFKYRSHVKKYQPESCISKLIVKWDQQRKDKK